MKALLDSGIANNQELLELVAEARTTVDGPAVAQTTPSSNAEAAA
jgi:hypothetical protein